MKERLEELREEFERGHDYLDSLDRQRKEVYDTLLRISGAIQVLEELSGEGKEAELEMSSEKAS